MARLRALATIAAVAVIISVGTAAAPAFAATSAATAPACLTHLPSHSGKFGGILAPRTAPWAITRACSTRSSTVSNTTPPALPYTGTPPLLHNGGAVMGVASAITVTPIYWDPTGFSYPGTYKSLTTRFLADVAHDSGSATNVFSSLTQYSDGSNRHLAYDVIAGSPITDTTAYPASGGCTADAGKAYSDGTGYSACVTDAQITSELSSVLSANGLTADTNHLYVVYLPKGVESCFSTLNDGQGGQCTISANGGAFCGYHSYSGSMLYADLPYAIEDNPVNGATCSSDGGVVQGGTHLSNEAPNGNLDADTVISVTSHELSEAFTDPYLNAWYDSSGNEVGDDCGYIYGDTSSFLGSAGALYNEVINGHGYFIQEELSNLEFASNSSSACVSEALTQSVSFTSTPPTNPPVSSGYVVTATATSGLAPTMSIDPSSSSVCTINGTTSGSFVSFKAVGTCTIDATQVGSSKFVPAPVAQQGIAVGGTVSDGAGALQVNPPSVHVDSTGDTLTFTYTAAPTGVSGGEIDVAVPPGWSAPSTTGASAGYVTSTCGSVGATGSTIAVTSVTLGASATCTISYGATSGGGPGASAPSAAFVTLTAGDVAIAVSTPLGLDFSVVANVEVVAADGTGTLTIPTTHTSVGASGNTLTFTYTAAAGGTSGGEVDVVVPAGWSAPSTSASAPGATTTTCGSAGVAGSTIRLTGVTLAANAQCTVTYGSRAAAGPGATATTTPGASTFQALEASTSTGTLTALAASPSVSVGTAGDGTGTMVVAPSTAQVAGSVGHTLSFTYVAAAGGVSGGETDVNIPAGWSAPSTSSSAPGYVTSTCGAVAVSGATIKVSGVTLAGGASCSTLYGSRAGTGSGATAGPTAGTATFGVTERSTGTGTLTSLSASPSIAVTKAATTTTLSLSKSTTIYGAEQLIKLSIILGASGTSLAASGTVKVTAGSVTVCTAAVVAGKGSCNPAPTGLGVGANPLVATFAGTGGLGASSSTSTTLTVFKAPSTTTLHLSSSTTTYAKESSERLSVTVVSGILGLSPKGTVVITSGKSTVCKLTLANARASCTLTAKQLKVGNVPLVATFLGATGMAGSSSSTKHLTVKP